MNRAILIVICDFLVSAMLSMMTGMVPAHTGGTGVGLDHQTTALLIAELRQRRQELTSAREKAERARLQKEAQQKAAEEKKAQQGFSVDPLHFHKPHNPPAEPTEPTEPDTGSNENSGDDSDNDRPADL